METYNLRDDVLIPKLGLGTWQMRDAETLKEIFWEGVRQGYRLIDTAAAYGNEIMISKALRELDIAREALFIQDKLWNTGRGYQEAQDACKKSLRKLKLDYLDAYLVHWPASPKLHENWREINAETWRGMEQLKQEGLVRVIGVCNFKQHHLESLAVDATELPQINQIEFHPGYCQKELYKYCKQNQIQVEASSPLGNGQILSQPLLIKIADKYQKSTAQICLRWGLQKRLVVIPKTSKKYRLIQNRKVFDFVLSEKEMALIDDMTYCGGLGIDPDEVTKFG